MSIKNCGLFKINNQAAADSFEESGIVYYEFIAVLDNRTSKVCQSRDGEVYPMSEKSVGFNYPPLHPRCRSTVAPYVEGSGRLGTRIAKVNGRRLHVPESMNYSEFKEKYQIKQENRRSKAKSNIKSNVERELEISNALEKTREELKLKGKIAYPPPKVDITNFSVDIEHARGGKHPHDVTEGEARRFVKEAYFVIAARNGQSLNYYGKEGGAFVRLDLKSIRTAFKSDEFNPKIKRLIEVYENEINK